MYKTGSVYGFDRVGLAGAGVTQKGTWNDYEIRVVDQHYSILRNGVLINEFDNIGGQVFYPAALRRPGHGRPAVRLRLHRTPGPQHDGCDLVPRHPHQGAVSATSWCPLPAGSPAGKGPSVSTDCPGAGAQLSCPWPCSAEPASARPASSGSPAGTACRPRPWSRSCRSASSSSPSRVKACVVHVRVHIAQFGETRPAWWRCRSHAARRRRALPSAAAPRPGRAAGDVRSRRRRWCGPGRSGCSRRRSSRRAPPSTRRWSPGPASAAPVHGRR